jgi:hypothetical protein
MEDATNSEDELIRKLEAVCDWDSFKLFVEALRADFRAASQQEQLAPAHSRGYGAFGWQNTNIEDFLECALAGLEANRQRSPELSEASWKTFAEFLYLGRN